MPTSEIDQVFEFTFSANTLPAGVIIWEDGTGVWTPLGQGKPVLRFNAPWPAPPSRYDIRLPPGQPWGVATTATSLADLETVRNLALLHKLGMAEQQPGH